jgi:hypothetical protein
MNSIKDTNSYESYREHWDEIGAITKSIKTIIKKVYDRYSIHAWHQLQIADDLYDYLTHIWGLRLQILNHYDFGYTIADHWHKQGYYIFIVKNNELIKTKWVAKRNQIGTMLHKYPYFDMIVYYPKSEYFRYYFNQKWEWGNKYLGSLKRCSEIEFKQRGKKQ